MNLYNIWCHLKSGVGDLDFSQKVAAYLGHPEEQGLIEGWRLMRRKLGLGPSTLGEFHIVIEVRDLAQLDAAFGTAASRINLPSSVSARSARSTYRSPSRSVKSRIRNASSRRSAIRASTLSRNVG